MSDDADKAELRIEDMIEDGLAKVRRRMEDRQLTPTGTCHNQACNDEVEGQRLFCGLKCSQEFERLKAR